MDASAPAPTVLIVGSRPGRIVRRPANFFAMASSRASWSAGSRRIARLAGPPSSLRCWRFIDRAGLIEPFLRAGVRIRHIQLLGPGLREIAGVNFADIGCKYEFQCSLPQWRTEAILRDHLESLGLKIEFGTEVKSIEDDPAGLRVTLDTGGRTEIVTAAYVLGAGGGAQRNAPFDAGASRGRDLRRSIYCRRRESSPSLPARMRPRHCGADRVRAGLAAAGRPLAYFCQSRRG